MALGVDLYLLKSQGSVNAEVVRQLACGALARSPADLALAASGVLGPEPDEDGNAVGLVYFCCCHRHGDPRVHCADMGQIPHDALRREAAIKGLEFIETCIER